MSARPTQPSATRRPRATGQVTGAFVAGYGLLRFVAEGPRFLQVDLQPQQQWTLGDDAVLFCGRLHLRLQRGDGPVQDAHSWVSALWQRDTAGNTAGAWQLAVFQSTKLPDA